MSRRRAAILLGVLVLLAVCHLVMNVASVYPPPPTKKAPPWLTQEKFYEYIEGQSIAPPGGESLTIHGERIESLRIEPGGEGPESEMADVSFVVRTDQGRYGVQGMMSMHSSDGRRGPVVNLGLGWDVTKK